MYRFLILFFLASFGWLPEIIAENDEGTQFQQIIKLPEPDKNVEMTFFDVLQKRHSSREFSSEEIGNETLSQLLWAACGINRPENHKLTAPSAMNRQSVSVYVCTVKGAYLWDAASNSLKKVSIKDLRPAVVNSQPNIGPFSLAFVMVGDNSKFDKEAIEQALPMVIMDGAIISQNINLAATALGLNNVPRVNMDQKVLKKELKLSATQFPIMNNLVGMPK